MDIKESLKEAESTRAEAVKKYNEFQEQNRVLEQQMLREIFRLDGEVRVLTRLSKETA